MKAYPLIVSLQIATGLPSAAIVLAFLVAPQWTVSVFGPELLLGLVVAFAALTLAAIGISFSSDESEDSPFLTKQRLKTMFMLNGIFVVVSCINGLLFRGWPLSLVAVVLLAGLVFLWQSRRYR